MSDPLEIENFKLFPYIDREYRSIAINNIDFKRDLKKEVSVSKRPTYRPDGRPEKSVYSINGEDMCCIVFEFHFDTLPNGQQFLANRKELLYFHDLDDNLVLAKVKSDNHFDPFDIADGIKIDQDRIRARSIIVSEIKVFISGALQQALQIPNKDVADLVAPMWRETLALREDFIELGTSGFEDWLNDENRDYTDPTFSWLVIPLDPATGFNLRQFILQRLSNA